jgi:hypothetical protein
MCRTNFFISPFETTIGSNIIHLKSLDWNCTVDIHHGASAKRTKNDVFERLLPSLTAIQRCFDRYLHLYAVWDCILEGGGKARFGDVCNVATGYTSGRM